MLARPGPDADILFVLDSTTPSSLASVAAPIAHLDRRRVAVLAPAAVDLPTAASDAFEPCTTVEALGRALPDLRCVVTIGHHLPLGALAHELATARGVPTITVQHGLLTPKAPPLPANTELLAWSEADAGFWAADRPDVRSRVVGSQLLWNAAASRSEARRDSGSGPLRFLGQLHGHELPRRDVARTSVRFCLDHDAVYRPHPSEIDLASRLQHRIWRRRGVRFDEARRPLTELDGAFVAIFSTGILEAAAAGRAAWVTHPDPPRWLADMWDRYGMAEYGSETPTTTTIPSSEPAIAIASIVTDRADHEPREGGRS